MYTFPFPPHNLATSSYLQVEVVLNMTSSYLAESHVMNGAFPSGHIIKKIQSLSDAIQLSARLVDMPPNILHTDAMVEEAGAVRDRVYAAGGDARILVIRGEELREKGFGGIYGK